MKYHQGRVHLYTGNGKGKTTATLGLALRSGGAGRRSLIIQFMKGQHYGELDAVRRLNGLITIEQHGSPDFCLPDETNHDHHQQLARGGLVRARQALADPSLDLVVLDEIVTAVYFQLLNDDDIINLLITRQTQQEVALTGRYASPELIKNCDLVTEMIEHRHYYQAGVNDRPGIET
ncbi:MAG: cob(I)yrinic acid a,c-diamide adenosyltransferase [Desulfosudaceae bacterium]